ncbi:hypothetical protein Q3G72_003769 [Acer saccharum]|nr:hypothetical protein Q3G72_003769 [Acer saccharum]
MNYIVIAGLDTCIFSRFGPTWCTNWSVSHRFSSSKSDDEEEESEGESSNGEEIDDDNTVGSHQFKGSNRNSKSCEMNNKNIWKLKHGVPISVEGFDQQKRRGGVALAHKSGSED